MPTFKFTVARESIHVQAYFRKPILKWQDVPSRFFETIVATLGQRLNVNPNELSLSNAQTLGEIRAKYSIYGGTTSVSLWADRLAFDFPNLNASDLPLVYEIMSSTHDAFQPAFPELELGKVDVQDYAHFDLGNQEDVTKYFEQFYNPATAEAFGRDIPVEITCSPKIAIVSQSGDWQSAAEVERSLFSSTAVFGSIKTSLFRLDHSLAYLAKAALVEEITRRCLSALNLEVTHAA